MPGTLDNLLFAVAVFVGSHFFLSSLPVRQPLIRRLGENGFRALYSLVAVVTLLWVVMAYGVAPYVPLWAPWSGYRLVPLLVMPVASILVVAGLTTRNVTAVGGERFAGGTRPVGGITTVTRHPFLWGVLLWALANLPANGDVASLVLFGGMAVLAIGGMLHIDHRRREILGSAWGTVALTTSAVPFLAAKTGRASGRERGGQE